MSTGRLNIPIVQLDPELPLPRYAHPLDAGMDLYARVPVMLHSGHRAVVPTGISIAVPPGYAAFVHPRSGLAARHGITVVNAPGTVDAGYRGELAVILANTDPESAHMVLRGDKIAQLVIQQVTHVTWAVVSALPDDSDRGFAGFGSTGLR